MTSANRPVIVAGNWKMYKTIPEALAFVQELIPLIKNCPVKVYLAVPFTLIQPASEAAKGTNLVIGAQNMNDASEGAFTGEISAKMLKDAGAHFVILGHSERRRLFHETDEFINQKVKRAIIEGLEVIFCIGETRDQRDAGQTHEVISAQLQDGLQGISIDQLNPFVIAYEPVWAIGMPRPAGADLAEEAQSFCRQVIGGKWGEEMAQKSLILYGGSVKPDNAKDFFEQPNIDGLLVGGASLSVQDFFKIINSYTTVMH